MSGRPGRPGTPGSGSSKQSGGYRTSGTGGPRRPAGPRRPGGSGGNNDNVIPLITGVLGSSILAFSLYVFSQNPGLLGEIVNGPDEPSHPSFCCDPRCPNYQPTETTCQPHVEACQPDVGSCQPAIHTYQVTREVRQPPVQAVPANPGPKISIEKKRWLTEEEEEIIKDRRLKEKQVRGKLQKELSEHLQKVKEIREELHKEKKSKFPWD